MLHPAFTAFVVSLAVITLELVQTRIFGVIFWNHLVYFIISIALLGFGISGTWLAFGKNTFLARHLSLNRAAWGFIFSALLSSLLVPHLGISIASIFADFSRILQLLCTYLAAILPYFFAGWMLGLVFRDHARQIHRLYFADLSGAALGCGVYLFGLRPLGPIPLIVIVSALVGSVIISDCKNLRQTLRSGLLLVGFLGLAIGFSNTLTLGIEPEPTKEFQRLYKDLKSDDKKIVEFTEWNSIARVDVVSSKKNPGIKRIFSDGDAHTPVVFEPPQVAPPFKAETEALLENKLPYLLKSDIDSVLVIGAGGGVDVWNALRAGAKSIDAVEINSTTVRLGLEEHGEVNRGLFRRAGVRLINEEGRNFVRGSQKKYDLIMIHAIDTFAAANAGAYVLSENYLYTVEAFADYFRHLKPDGLLCITRWANLVESLRLFITGLEMLYQEGVAEPERHAILVSTNWAALVLSRKPFSAEALNPILPHSLRWGGVPLFPRLAGVTLKGEAALYRHYAQVRAENRQNKFFVDSKHDVRPVNDDSPFFFHFEKWQTLHRVFQEKGAWIRGNWPSFTLASLLCFSLICLSVFILAPLLATTGSLMSPHFARWIIYFASIGLSFIFVEIALMQRFSLLLGHPSRSLVWVLGGILFFAGIGSYLSNRLQAYIHWVLALLGFLILIMAHLYPAIVAAALYWPLWLRVALALGLIFLPALCMGTAFPSGIRQVAASSDSAVPWMWGINAGATVIGSLLAIILAMGVNFTFVLTLASIGYFIAMLTYGLSIKGQNQVE